LLGCYGEQNTGDEALLAGTLNLLRSRWPDSAIHVFSDSPHETARAFDVESSSSTGFLRPRNFLGLWRRGELGRIFRAIRWCDCLIVGGGELLRTDFGLWPVLSTFDRVLLAHLLRKPVIMLGVGAGELSPGLALRILRFAAARSILLVREDESVIRLAKSGLLHAKAIPDLAFQFTAQPHGLVLPPGHKVGFSLLASDIRPQRRLAWLTREQFTRQLAETADRVVELGATPVFIPFSFAKADDDRAIHRDIVARMKYSGRSVLVEENPGAARIKGLIAEMDIIVGMRLHACIFGLAAKRPVVALGYDSKVTKLMRSFGLEGNLTSLESLDKLPGIVAEAWSERHTWAERLQPYLERDARRLAENFGTLFERN
jgi:polysaccharide pyruvyl transferase WcaK-like protein